MAGTTFDETLDFAIAREKEAVAFYEDLRGLSRFSAQRELLGEFAAMERGHATLLEGVKASQDPGRLSKPVPADLRLDAFLVPSPPAADMTYQDILITAIAREKKSADLYRALENDSGDDDLRDVFRRLTSEEENHKNFFETLYERDISRDN